MGHSKAPKDWAPRAESTDDVLAYGIGVAATKDGEGRVKKVLVRQAISLDKDLDLVVRSELDPGSARQIADALYKLAAAVERGELADDVC